MFAVQLVLETKAQYIYLDKASIIHSIFCPFVVLWSMITSSKGLPGVGLIPNGGFLVSGLMTWHIPHEVVIALINSLI